MIWDKKLLVYFLIFLAAFFLGACQPSAVIPDVTDTALSSLSLPETPTNALLPEKTPTPALPQQTQLLTLWVPEGEPEAVDGVISAGEWDNAVVDTFSDDSEILLMYKDSFLYVAIRANTTDTIAGNVYLSTGDEIWIYHASAALGTGQYKNDVGRWQLVQAFEWCCRQKSTSEIAQNELDTFFQEEGWISINSWMGTPNELEYKIALPEGNFRLAANFIAVSTNEKIPWPQDLADDSTIIATRGLPENMEFAPDEWVEIAIQ